MDNFFEKEEEIRTLRVLLLLELEEENEPDYQQYANLKWKVRE